MEARRDFVRGAARGVDIAAASLEARPEQVKERRVVNVR